MCFTKRLALAAALAAAASLFASSTRADAVTDWNIAIGEIVLAANLGPPPANRVVAITHTAIFEAANAITMRYPANSMKVEATTGASVDAAIAAASREALAKCLPLKRKEIDSAYFAALAKIADGPAKTAGLAVGNRAAAAVLARRFDDGAATVETYRPHASPGAYVPTTMPSVPQWPKRRPWIMASADQFRPGPPPVLSSAIWARDYNEVKELGSKNSIRRTSEQTEIALFWEATLPPVYHGLVRSVASMPGRDVTQNARLFAAVTQATDDALIAVMDAKYHYGLWRPMTAIRNGDIDGNDATERDPSWLPLIDTPVHPEYPCAHCIQSAAVGAVLKAEIGAGPKPTLTTTSYMVKDSLRSWMTVEDFVKEVSQARIYDGVHYRTSTEVGMAMGKQIGELVVAKFTVKQHSVRRDEWLDNN